MWQHIPLQTCESGNMQTWLYQQTRLDIMGSIAHQDPHQHKKIGQSVELLLHNQDFEGLLHFSTPNTSTLNHEALVLSWV